MPRSAACLRLFVAGASRQLHHNKKSIPIGGANQWLGGATVRYRSSSTPAASWDPALDTDSEDITEAASATVFQRQPLDTRYTLSQTRKVPSHIVRPPYAHSGHVPSSFFPERVLLHDEPSIVRMRAAAQLARQVLDLACAKAKAGVTTDEIDGVVHTAICQAGAYPSPLNYAGFPKSLCASVNEVICHGIPTPSYVLQKGDVVSFDVSCFFNGVHGDNCATVIVGDEEEDDTTSTSNKDNCDWRGVPYRTHFESPEEQEHLEETRRLVQSTRDSLYAAIDVCHAGNCLSDIGAAIEAVADRHHFKTVKKYRGHGISHQFHCAPYVKHFRNNDRLELQPGMIFTIEPMFTIGSADCFEWEDEWTVATRDGSIAAQFEHTILILEEGPPEILTLAPPSGVPSGEAVWEERK